MLDKAQKPICIPTGSVHTFDSIGTTVGCVTCLVKQIKHNEGKLCEYNVHALGHSIWAVPPFAFCAYCGSYSESRIGTLSLPCPNSATTLHFTRAKHRLLEGRHPVSNVFLSNPYPVCRIILHNIGESLQAYDDLEITDGPDGYLQDDF